MSEGVSEGGREQGWTSKQIREEEEEAESEVCTFRFLSSSEQSKLIGISVILASAITINWR